MRRPGALDVGLALALAAPLALWRARAHVVPTLDGPWWRGLSDPPSVLRVAAALGAGALLALLLSRWPAAARRPLLVMAVALAPLVPVLGGLGSVLLLFQGPVLAVVGAAALALAVLRARPWRIPDRVPGAALFAIALGFYGIVGTGLPGLAGPQGDEPHYLAMAQSVLTDGDLDLADEFENQEYAAFFSGDLRPHTSPASPPGTLYPVHTPGLAVLLLPAYALGGATGARLLVSVLAALATVLAHRVAREVLDSPGLAAGVWAIVTFTPPLPFYAVSLYPETPAALATAVFLTAARRPGATRWLVAAALAAAALPWLHPKFLPLAAAGVAVTVAHRGLPRARAVAAAAVLGASLALLLWFFAAHYGRPSLGAAYGPGLGADVSLARVPGGALALLTDRQFGLLAVSPIWFLALPGLAGLLRAHRADAARGLLLAGASFVLGAAFSMWWGGACPPARFVVPALPVLALALGPALRARPTAAAALGGASLAVVLLALHAPRLLHNRNDGESALLRFLAPALDLDGGLPSFVPEATPAALVLAVTLLAAGVLGWAGGLRGLLAGAAAYALAAGAVRERPWIDPRGAAQQLLAAWEPGRLRGPHGPPLPSRLFVPLDLPGAPWTLAPGDLRHARREDLPPGLYRLDVAGHALEAPGGTNVALLEVWARELPLERAYLRAGEPDPSLPLLLPLGARGLRLSAAGVQAAAVLRGARAVPLELAPASLRERLPWPRRADAGRYRVPRGGARVTVLDRSVPEGEGFRLDGPDGAFLVELVPGSSVDVRVSRERADAAGFLRWGSRRIALTARPVQTLNLPAEPVIVLGGVALVPAGLEAPDAWIAFSSAPPR